MMECGVNTSSSPSEPQQNRGQHNLTPTPECSTDEGCQQQSSNSSKDSPVVSAVTELDVERPGTVDEPGKETLHVSQHFYAGNVTEFNIQSSPNLTLSLGGSRRLGFLTHKSLSARIKRLRDVFVEVHTLEKAKMILKKYGHVTICGAPGDGKTSIALILCQEYRLKNYETLFVDNLDDIDIHDVLCHGNDLLLVFDDVFGSVTFSCNLEKTEKLFRELDDVMIDMARSRKDNDGQKQKRKEKQVQIVFTSRTYNFNEGGSKFPMYRTRLFRQETVLDLTREGLTSEERAEIISSFRTWSKMCDITDQDIQTMSGLKNDMFGFPLICKLYFSTPNFQINTLEFFSHPLPYLRGDLDLIVREGSSRSAAIILLILCGGRLDLLSLQDRSGTGTDETLWNIFDVLKGIVPGCTPCDIGKEIYNFSGTYCTVDNQIATFSHPSIYDAAACAFGKLNIVLLLKYCSLRFLFERVRANKTDSYRVPEPDSATNVICIDKRMYPLVVSRLVDGMKQRYFSGTVNHPILGHDGIATSLLTELEGLLPEIVQDADIETEKGFLYWTTLSDCDLLFLKALELVGEIQHNTSECSEYSNAEISDKGMTYLQEALVPCVQNGKVAFLQKVAAVLQKLNNFNVNFQAQKDKPLLVVAAEAGHLKVFNYLMQETADPSLPSKQNKNCLHISCESGNKDIAEVILNRCPDLIDKPEGFGRTPAIICSEMGHLRLLKFLVSRGANLDLTDLSASNCLHMACMGGHVHVVKYLISLKKPSLNINRSEGLYNQTPVMLAAEGGHCDVFKVLAEEGADLSLTDYSDKDCLMFACERGNTSIVKHILSLKLTDVNRRGGYSQQSPVMFASERGHYDIVRLLESEGADLTLTDKYGRAHAYVDVCER